MVDRQPLPLRWPYEWIAAVTVAEASSDDSVIEVVDVPQANTVAAAPVLLTRQERVCHREKRTGTNRVVRVCRTRAQIEREELESKELFDDLHRSQQEYGH